MHGIGQVYEIGQATNRISGFKAPYVSAKRMLDCLQLIPSSRGVELGIKGNACPRFYWQVSLRWVGRRNAANAVECDAQIEENASVLAEVYTGDGATRGIVEFLAQTSRLPLPLREQEKANSSCPVRYICWQIRNASFHPTDAEYSPRLNESGLDLCILRQLLGNCRGKRYPILPQVQLPGWRRPCLVDQCL